MLAGPEPTTPLLDNFNRADNAGPPSPSWSLFPAPASKHLHIVGNQVTGFSGASADYWNASTFGPDSEAWVTVAVKPTANLDTVTLGLRFQNPGLATASGYEASFINRTRTVINSRSGSV